MGHYRSEMGYEAEDAARATEEEQRRRNVLRKIVEDIDKRGVAEVLTDIVFEGTRSYRIRRCF